MLVNESGLPGMPLSCTSVSETPDPTNGLLKFESKKNLSLVFSRDESDVSTLSVVPSVSGNGGFTDDPMLINLF